MQRILLALIATVLNLGIAAETVDNCRAGQLASRIGDHSITALDVSGHIDARDFRFIADSLRQLSTLDLRQAVVDAYHGTTLFANVSDYAANTVPCQSLASMQELQSLWLPRTVTHLGEGCLAGCPKLNDLVLPWRLTHIGDYALSGCERLVELGVPQSLTHIGDGALMGCTALERIAMLEPNAEDTVTVTPSPLHIGTRAFANCQSLTMVSLGTMWHDVDAEAFAETGLKQLNLGDQSLLTELPDWSLSNTPLTSLILPNSLQRVGEGSLMNVEGIAQLTLPAQVSYIGSYAMAYTTGLKQLNSQPTRVPALGDSVWYGIDQSKVLLKVDAGSLTDYRNAAQWCNFMTSNPLRGDVNGDGRVDIIDINILINIMLGRDQAEKYDGRAYINDDQVVDIIDINAEINIMLARLRALRQAAEEAARLKARGQQTAAQTSAATPPSLRMR